MTQRGSFFDSTAGDRIYDAATLARALAAIVTDGVVDGSGSELAVTEQTPAAMGVKVATGIAFVRGYYFEVYSTTEAVALAAAHATLPRIDLIVVRRDLAARTISLAVVTGTPAASPAAPALTQVTGGVWEFPLAQVAVGASVASIVNANITDLRTYASTSPGTRFDTAVGHDHDGADSKKVTYTDLLSIPATFAPAAHAASHLPGGADALTVAAPGASAVGDVAAAGAAASFSRSDHKHGREAFGSPAGSAVGDVSADGVATTLARSDHKHAREAFASPGAIVLGSAAGAGAATTPLRSDATIAAFDATNPVDQAIGDAAAVGAAAKAARRDHKHGMPVFGAVTAETVAGSAASNGASANVARADHAHGNPAAPTAASLGAPLAYDSPATADGGKRIYVGTSAPTGMSEGDVWIKG